MYDVAVCFSFLFSHNPESKHRRIQFLCTPVFSWRQCTPIHSRYRSYTRYTWWRAVKSRKKNMTVDNHRCCFLFFYFFILLSHHPKKIDFSAECVPFGKCTSRVMYRNDGDGKQQGFISGWMMREEKEKQKNKTGKCIYTYCMKCMKFYRHLMCTRAQNDREWFDRLSLSFTISLFLPHSTFTYIYKM